MTYEIVDVGQAALQWPFRGDVPQVKIGKTYTPVDPFPCYAHDSAVVEDTLKYCLKALPLPEGTSITYYLSQFEDSGRTNAFASYDHQWIEDGSERGGHYTAGDRVVYMAGKRTPLHRAMTRFVTAHEYGHQAQWTIEIQTGRETDSLKPEYKEFRGLPDTSYYGGHTWHLQPGEVFADDFRILCAGIDPDHWPHPGVSHPLDDLAVQEWWAMYRGLGSS